MEIETRREKTEHGWKDVDGFVGPFPPGKGPRTDPAGDFPTGPAIGERLPDISAVDQHGAMVDVHQARGGRPAVVSFYRSAVW